MKNRNSAHALTGSACLESVLARLDKVKPDGASKWKACCPAHDDTQPSLAIKETSDGTVLLHCFAGCTARDITAAVGLELRDLFASEHQRRRGPSKGAIQHERAVYQIGLTMQMHGFQLNAEDQARFEIAKRRLGVAK